MFYYRSQCYGNSFFSTDEMQMVMESVIKKGRKIKVRWDKVTFDFNGFRVIVSKNVRDALGKIIIENKNWVVTSFDNNNPKSKKNASDITLVTLDNTSGGRAVASDAVS